MRETSGAVSGLPAEFGVRGVSWCRGAGLPGGLREVEVAVMIFGGVVFIHSWHVRRRWAALCFDGIWDSRWVWLNPACTLAGPPATKLHLLHQPAHPSIAIIVPRINH